MNIPQNLQRHFEIIETSGIDAADLFRLHELSRKEKLVRRYLVPLVQSMPLHVKYRLTGFAKKIRNPSGALNLRYPLDFPECRVIAQQIKDLDLRPWWGKRGVICLCHDVDNRIGYAFLNEMIDINRSRNIRATFNFLTHEDYPIDTDVLSRIRESGSEVGLHGYDHDQGFAFRHPDLIRHRLRESLDVLNGKPVLGFRSAALSTSEELFAILKENHVLYDSSLQIGSPFYRSVRLPYPYYMERYGLWEIPLMVQDDNYFRDTKTPEYQVFESIDRFIDEVKQLNGVFVINMHPHIMGQHKEFYKNFVDKIARYEDMAVSTVAEVVHYAQSHDHHQ